MDGLGKVDEISAYEVYNPLGEKTGEAIQGRVELACPQNALFVADIKTANGVVRRLIYLSSSEQLVLGSRIRPYGSITIGK